MSRKTNLYELQEMFGKRKMASLEPILIWRVDAKTQWNTHTRIRTRLRAIRYRDPGRVACNLTPCLPANLQKGGKNLQFVTELTYTVSAEKPADNQTLYLLYDIWVRPTKPAEQNNKV